MSLALPQSVLPHPSTAPALNWGILGPGWIASQFATSLKELTKSKLAAIGSRTLARSEDFARTYGDDGTRAYGSYAQVLEDPAVDVLYIAVPHSGHAELALQAIAAGKHVLVEKPLSLNAQQSAQIVQAAKAAGVFAMEAMWSRLLPIGNVVSQVIASGMLGQIITVQADFGAKFPVDYESRIYDPALGGGALLDVGIYPIAFSAMVSPAKQLLHASGRLAKTGVDASFTAVLANEDGSTATVFSSIETESPQSAWIAGTEGTLELQRPICCGSGLVLRSADGNIVDSREFTETSPAAGLGWEAAHVAQCIADGLAESPVMPLDQSLAIAQTMDEIAARLRA
ncbi:Gfo/Idh/MocA family protein [Glutamicibacter arilaitensis]|uniref:Gfo/Idh/MocA family oxidoreductase n=1 Tax=Glutamicibacter arilaitensis TaxID=256701 RepID=A0A4Y8TW17_9MICC|nr:Gfo/Idh/MocA family oxidoreductase [Glutamicibacter arilaitensis]TFH55731.1 Gfo/Idh/MocA family oxidoreductase [Glutamicibacter arilaitensis]